MVPSRPLPRHRDHLLDLLDRDDREALGEQQEPHAEPAERPEQDAPVGPGDVRVGPGPRDVVVAERGGDDHEALEPHPEIDEDRDDEQRRQVGADLPEPEQLRHEGVADDHGPAGPPHRPEGAAEEGGLLERVAAVPRHEVLHRVGVEQDRAGQQGQLGQVVEVIVGDHVLDPERPPERDDQRHHHAEARVDGAGHEVGGEDGAVPAGDDRRGEVPAHHRVHREHQRRGQRGQVEVGARVVPPLVVGALPAGRCQRVDRPPPAGDLVAHGRHVGNQAEHEEASSSR